MHLIQDNILKNISIAVRKTQPHVQAEVVGMDGGESALGSTELFKGHFPTRPCTKLPVTPCLSLRCKIPSPPLSFQSNIYLSLYNWSVPKDAAPKAWPGDDFSRSTPLPSSTHIARSSDAPLQPARWSSRGKNAFSCFVLGKRPATPAPETPKDLHRKSCGLNWFDFVGWQTFRCSVWMHAGPVYKLNKKMIQGFLIPKWLAR